MFHKSILVLVFATVVLIPNIHGANVKFDNIAKDLQASDAHITPFQVPKHENPSKAHSIEFYVRHTRELRVNPPNTVLKSGNATSIQISNTNTSVAQNTSKRNEFLNKIKDGITDMVKDAITDALIKDKSKIKNIFKGNLKDAFIEAIADGLVGIGVNIVRDEIEEFMQKNDFNEINDIQKAVEKKTKEIYNAIETVFKDSAKKLKEKGKTWLENIG